MSSADGSGDGPAPRRGRGPGQAPRADAVRNRVKVVEAAHQVFCELGPDVSVREVARAAGVGLGTVYRHFPDKDALLAAVVEQRFRMLADETRSSMASMPPWPAFAHMMRFMAEMMVQDRAFAGAVGAARMSARAENLPADDPRVTRDRARDDLDAVLLACAESAQAAGELRTDVGPMELGLLLAGAGLMGGAPGVTTTRQSKPTPLQRYLDVVLDGLRTTSSGARGGA